MGLSPNRPQPNDGEEVNVHFVGPMVEALAKILDSEVYKDKIQFTRKGMEQRKESNQWNGTGSLSVMAEVKREAEEVGIVH